MVSETTELASVTPTNVPYLFFEIILVFWQRTVLEQRSLQLLGDQMSVAVKLDSTLTATRSFLLLTVAKYVKKRIIYLRL